MIFLVKYNLFLKVQQIYSININLKSDAMQCFRYQSGEGKNSRKYLTRECRII